MATVDFNGHYFEVSDTENGYSWTFDREDADLSYIDDAIEAWNTWRAYVIRAGLSNDG